MTDNDFKAGEEKGLVLGELKLIRQELMSIKDAFTEFKSGVGIRLEKITEAESICKLNVSNELVKLKEDQSNTLLKMNELAESKNWIIKIIVGAFIAALIALVIKK